MPTQLACHLRRPAQLPRGVAACVAACRQSGLPPHLALGLACPARRDRAKASGIGPRDVAVPSREGVRASKRPPA